MWEVLLSNITLFEKGSVENFKCLSDSPNYSFIQTFTPIRPQDTLEDSALVPENTLPMLAGPCLPSWLFLLRNFFDLAMCTFYCFKLHIWLSVYVENLATNQPQKSNSMNLLWGPWWQWCEFGTGHGKPALPCLTFTSSKLDPPVTSCWYVIPKFTLWWVRVQLGQVYWWLYFGSRNDKSMNANNDTKSEHSTSSLLIR